MPGSKHLITMQMLRGPEIMAQAHEAWKMLEASWYGCNVRYVQFLYTSGNANNGDETGGMELVDGEPDGSYEEVKKETRQGNKDRC